MRRPRLSTPVVTVGIAVLAAGVAGTGIGVAATKKPPTFKACATKANVLTLANGKGKCAKGTHAVSLNAQGPAGPAGAAGATGAKGATGATGTTGTSGAASAVSGRVARNPADATIVRRDLVSIGNVTIQTGCYPAGGGFDVTLDVVSSVTISGLIGFASDAANADSDVIAISSSSGGASADAAQIFPYGIGGHVDGRAIATVHLHSPNGGTDYDGTFTISATTPTLSTYSCDVEGTLRQGPVQPADS